MNMHGELPVSVQPPTFEHHHDGFGIQVARPRISWRFSCSNNSISNWEQTSVDIEIAPVDEPNGEIFGIQGAQSVLVPWPSPKSLESRTRLRVRVRSHGRYLNSQKQVETSPTDWSAWSKLEVALLENSDWTGRMMTTKGPWPLAEDRSARPLAFQKTFKVPSSHAEITRARLYITSHGMYVAQLNGKKIGDHCLSPGLQSYHKRLHYQVYDVKKQLLTAGENKLSVEVAPGWFASACSWAKNRFIFGKKLGVLAQLEIWTGDSPEPWTVNTDESWTASTSGIQSSEIYDGEVCDLRLLHNGNHNEPLRFATEESPTPISKLVSPEAAPIRVIEQLVPKAIFASKSGDSSIIDFGQNCAGRIRIRKIMKPSGSVITFRHAEVMQDGDIMCRPLRTAKARDVLICDGTEIVNWHPKYTFHGFRYVEVTGWSPEDEEHPLNQDSMVVEVLHTDMARTGWFSCSNADINRLHENALWGMKSNFLSVPLECPSRDERFGWTGDLNIFAPTATFLHDTSGILRHWLDDVYLDQMDESPHWRKGVVPLFVPNCLLRRENDHDLHAWDPMPNAVWGDAAIMVPWQLYIMSGDVELLSRQYDGMLQWLEQGVVRDKDNLWSPDQWQFADWLDPRAPQNDSGRGTTDGTYVADCFLILSTRIISEVARTLNMTADASRFTQAAQAATIAWQKKYLSPVGNVVPDTATALALALSLDLIPDESDLRRQAAARLSRNVRFNDFKITSGFVGTSVLSRALTKVGEVEVAYAMLYQKKCPSYLYPITMGATTIWERWDSMLPDGTVNPGSMTSFNHHALGSIAHWLHTDVGGLEPIEPGWKVFRVRPWPNKEMAWAETIFESPYGRIELKWTLDEDEHCKITLRVPPNSSAVVSLPEDGNHDVRVERVVRSGLHVFECCFSQAKWPPKPILPPWGRAEF